MLCFSLLSLPILPFLQCLLHFFIFLLVILLFNFVQFLLIFYGFFNFSKEHLVVGGVCRKYLESLLLWNLKANARAVVPVPVTNSAFVSTHVLALGYRLIFMEVPDDMAAIPLDPTTCSLPCSKVEESLVAPCALPLHPPKPVRLSILVNLAIVIYKLIELLLLESWFINLDCVRSQLIPPLNCIFAAWIWRFFERSIWNKLKLDLVRINRCMVDCHRVHINYYFFRSIINLWLLFCIGAIFFSHARANSSHFI